MVKSIDYTVEQFYNVEVAATGYFKKLSDDGIDISIKYFHLKENKSTHTFSDLEVKESRFIPKHGLTNHTDASGQLVYGYNISSDLIAERLDFVFQSVLYVRINFSLHSVRVHEPQNAKEWKFMATCLKITGNVTFNDMNHNGQVIMDLKTKTGKINCSTIGYKVKEADSDCETIYKIGWAVIAFLGGSVVFETFAIFIWWITCCRRFRLLGCLRFKKGCKMIWNRYKEENLTFQGRLGNIRCRTFVVETFAKLWEIATIVGDFLIGSGVILFFDVCGKPHVLADLDKAAVLDGTGMVLCYFTFIRFMKFNSKFSLLFNTIKNAAKGIVCFLSCVAILFVGSYIFAYVVLGPYHVKFDDKLKTSDTLFSIINGDEIYATMAILQDGIAGNSALITTFMHIFVYTYVLLFTVLVFNLLIALFNSAYEEMQKLDEEKETQKLNGSGLVSEHLINESRGKCRMNLKETYELSNVLKEWKIPCTGYWEEKKTY